MDTDYIRSHIRNIPDFPEEGIQFKDITPLLLDAKASVINDYISNIEKHISHKPS